MPMQETTLLLISSPYEPQWLESLVALLKGHRVIVVSVTLPLEILEQRAARATSPKGHARSHYETVHRHNVPYSLEIDSLQITPEQAAESIVLSIK